MKNVLCVCLVLSLSRSLTLSLVAMLFHSLTALINNSSLVLALCVHACVFGCVYVLYILH